MSESGRPGGAPASTSPDPPVRPSGFGWRLPASTLSLPEAHGTVDFPATGTFWRKLMAFAGPGYFVAVGYMDPGNWATDLAGGARYGYALLSVV
jgi:manganese transport protein